MDFLIYNISFNNFEENDCYVQLRDFDTFEDPIITFYQTELQGTDEPAIMETPNLDDDKTVSIRPKRLRTGFNSGTYSVATLDTIVDVGYFSDGSEGRFNVFILCGGVARPFWGSLILDDNTEAFQPRPNPVQLIATDGLNSLKDVELKTVAGETPIGHYSIIDYIVMCLSNLRIDQQQIKVVFNIYEKDQNPTTQHAFEVTYLDALTFETDVDKRDDCLTVLQKICDAFGCFICNDHIGWWIIRWDEYDNFEANVSTMRVGTFGDDGTFGGYTNETFDKVIASDYDLDYDGYFLSQDSAQRRFQRKANAVIHTYKFETPKEIPCNAKFTRGTPDDTVLPLLTFEPECWTMRKGVPGSYGTAGSDARIAVRYDANGYETERFVFISPEGTFSSSSTNQTYLESSPITVKENAKFNCDVDWRLESDADNGNNYNLLRFWLHGDDGSDWLLGNEDINDSSTPPKWWDTSNFTVNTAAGGTDIDFTLIDETEWQSLSFEAPAMPVTGKLYLWLHQINQTNISEDNQIIDYTGINFTYIPLINGTYKTSLGQELKVSADNEVRKVVEKQMFISDSPDPLFKGAMKKYDGSNYVLTETWTEWNNVSFTNERMSKYIVFQWWNQFRKTRTVIESDIQGIKSDEETGIPGLIHRYQIKHADEGDKYYMLTSMRGLNFRTCGWQGVFVEMSSAAGDKIYTDTFNFKYIQ